MILRRLATFLFMIGGVLVVLFIISETANSPSYKFLLIGVAFIALSVLIWWAKPRERVESNRFRLFRKKKDED